VSYLDLVVANARSVMDNIIVYMETGSSSVSQGNKRVKYSESVPLSEQDISEQDISEQGESKVSQDISEVSESESEVNQDESEVSEDKSKYLEDRRIDMVRFNRYIEK